ncbi:hypothetical protein EB796_015613 [Bugula neritina]|uniref:Uncharacterized protein n=1 Tax=Bugula neritina TaxID=10212 RepID=A0A7J7JJ42_BUGNE|nr:hypothetical protein EB796_015613 [Bugula neritina]
MLCSVILHTSMSEVSMGESTLSTLYQVCQNQDYWCMFRVARQALRYGQYQLALRLLETLNHQVTSNGAIYFISCLKWFVSSQISLQSPSDESGELSISELDSAILSLTKAIRSIEAASKFSSQFNFHSTYLNLLLSDLETHRRAQCVCNMYWSCPPPAIGKIEGARTGDDLIRYGRLTEELRKCSADFHLLYSRYSSLQETLLDADTETHRHVKMLMERIFLMTQLVDSLLSGEKQFSDSITQEADENSAFLNSIKREWPNVTSFSDSHEVVISLQQIRALKAASYRLLTEQRLPLPRYFFQKLQTTTATINVRPHQKPGESVLMHAQSYLTLTVEGIISYSSSDHQKKVKKVSVELQSRVQQSGSASHGAADVLGKESPKTETNLQNTVKVVNEYFCTDFLLAFPLPGIHSVKIACKVIDCNDIHWDIGCTADITVKSYKEKKHSSLMKSST